MLALWRACVQIKLDELAERNNEMAVQLATLQRMYTREVRLREVLKVRRHSTSQHSAAQRTAQTSVCCPPGARPCVPVREGHACM